jgi:hypothetical protein
MTEKWALLSKRKTTLCFSTTVKTTGAPWRVYQEPEPGQEALGPIIQGRHLSGDRNSVTSSGFLNREGRVLEGTRAISWAALPQTLSFEVSLLSTMVASPDILSLFRREFSRSHH